MSEITISETIEQLRGIKKTFNDNRVIKIGRITLLIDDKTIQVLDKAIEVIENRDEDMNIIKIRQLQILSEPNSVVRETMIKNLLMGL